MNNTQPLVAWNKQIPHATAVLCGDWAWEHQAGAEEHLNPGLTQTQSCCVLILPAAVNTEIKVQKQHIMYVAKEDAQKGWGQWFSEKLMASNSINESESLGLFSQMSLNSSEMFTPTTLRGNWVSETHWEDGNSY